jgi:NADH dehydrogenase/NADH:ubiquinone oxidoreductase 75 kD subunit (chain G)
MVVYLDSPRVQRHRQIVLELLLAMTDDVPQLRALAARFKVTRTRFAPRHQGEKCIGCGLCTRVCREVVGAEAITMAHRGERRALERAPFGEFPESCIGCGACAALCPTGAISMEEVAVYRLRQAWGAERPCRYALMGLAPGTLCENDYACGRCEFDQRMIDRAAGEHPVFLKLKGS